MVPFAVISRVNSVVYSGLSRAKTGQQVASRNLIWLVSGLNNFPFGGSWFSFFSLHSTQFTAGTSRVHLNCRFKRNFMAASGSTPVFGDVHTDDVFSSGGKIVDFAKPITAFFNDRSKTSCEKASLTLRKEVNRHLVTPHLISDVSLKICNMKSSVAPWLKKINTMSSACYAAKAAHDLPFDGKSRDEKVANVAAPADRTILGNRFLKLLSGSCYLPHPDKKETGGEDAHFICEDEQAIGVADGVGGWADVGINAGLYARELMSNSVKAIKQEPEGLIDPPRVLEKAHSRTKAKGSSTACIITLADENINAINLGDSGFIVVRDGCTVFQSPSQQHEFNFTYQLENSSEGDPPSSGQIFKIPVVPGDTIVAGTDGVFDNLYNNEITSVVVQAVRAGLSPQATAQKIAALARRRALDRNRPTPFSIAAQDAGYRYYGGKLDDTTVIVSFVTGLVAV